jgi:hypothetical protein
MIGRYRSACRWLSAVLVPALFLGALVLAAHRVFAQGEDGAGLVVSGQASAKDVGLPVYPGATPHKDSGEDSNAARLGFWGGGSGFKLAVMKLESKDSPRHVADFYQRALAKYGKVLDCTRSGASDEPRNDPKTLACGEDKPDNDGMLFKSGTKEKQHIVAIEPYGKGSAFALVYLWAKGD